MMGGKASPVSFTVVVGPRGHFLWMIPAPALSARPGRKGGPKL